MGAIVEICDPLTIGAKTRLHIESDRGGHSSYPVVGLCLHRREAGAVGNDRGGSRTDAR